MRNKLNDITQVEDGGDLSQCVCLPAEDELEFKDGKQLIIVSVKNMTTHDPIDFGVGWDASVKLQVGLKKEVRFAVIE
jgi:hypothetical protein